MTHAANCWQKLAADVSKLKEKCFLPKNIVKQRIIPRNKALGCQLIFRTPFLTAAVSWAAPKAIQPFDRLGSIS